MPVLYEVGISKQRPASNLRTTSGLRLLSSGRMWSNAFWETLRFPVWVWIPDFVSHNALAWIPNSCRGNCEVVAILRTEWRLVSRLLRAGLSVPPGLCLGKVSALLSPTFLRSMQNCGIRWVNRPFNRGGVVVGTFFSFFLLPSVAWLLAGAWLNPLG